MIENKSVYDAPAVAADYGRQAHLQPAEETILQMMRPHLPKAKMLDLGVGGGRTTLHFAHLVREYVGADYSEAMIIECRKRFSGFPTHISFKLCDARSMQMFENGSFDFILFSHNGIDCVSHEDRLKILQQIQRVGRSGGYFCFSTHNLNWAVNLFELRRMISLDPRLALRTAKRVALRCFYNWRVRASAVKNSPYILFNDGAHHRKMQMHYIRPLEQIAALSEAFGDIRVFSSITGAEIGDQIKLRCVEDPWLYYLCKIK